MKAGLKGGERICAVGLEVVEIVQPGRKVNETKADQPLNKWLVKDMRLVLCAMPGYSKSIFIGSTETKISQSV